MSTIVRTPVAAGLFLGGLAAYMVLVALAGSDPHVPRGVLPEVLALLSAWVMVAGAVIGVGRVLAVILDADGDLPWQVPEKKGTARKDRIAA